MKKETKKLVLKKATVVTIPQEELIALKGGAFTDRLCETLRRTCYTECICG